MPVRFQYRKRYGLHAIMNNPSFDVMASIVSIPQAVWIACNPYLGSFRARRIQFQYRKRYGLHAMASVTASSRIYQVSIPQAVWIACNGSKSTLPTLMAVVSIPQAVWIACNEMGFVMEANILKFQYRKRYGLHAIPSLTALGTAKPRSGFSKRSALFGKSPQPRGIFLSPKTAENVRKPCNIKETFVHGKSMKLMAFSPKSLPSL